MSDVLIASVPINGHVTPLLTAAAGLVERGYNVRFLTGARFASLVEETRSSFIALPAEADYDDRQLGLAAAAEPRPRGIAGLRHDVGTAFLAPARAQYQALLQQVATPTKAVLVDPTFLGAFLLAGHSTQDRPPVILGGLLPLALSSAHVPPFGLGLRPLAGRMGGRLLDTARNSVLRCLVEQVVFRPVQRDLDALYHSVHGRPANAFILNWMSTVDAIVQFSVPAFEYPRPDTATPTYFAGPMARPSRVDVPAWWNDLRTATRVVHVTQGTLANTDLTALVRPTLEGLAEEDVLVVVTTGGRPVEELGPVPPNARVEQYLPYDQFLPLVDVMVTNGGYGGVHHALAHGVPLVVAGATEDKPEVAARIAWSGAGVNLRTGRPRARAVRRAVLDVLRSSSHRAAAAVVAGQIAEARGVDGLVDVIEDLDRRRARTEQR